MASSSDPLIISSDSDREIEVDEPKRIRSENQQDHSDESDDDLPSFSKELLKPVSNESSSKCWIAASEPLTLFRNGSTEFIYINYASGEYAKVCVMKVLQKLLIDEKLDLVLVGEGNFTFSVAIAALRQSWDGIISTCYEQKTSPELQIDKVKLKSVAHCISNGLKLNTEPSTILGNIHHIICLQPPPDGTWLFGINGTNIPDHLNVQGKVVWFQCPWLPRTSQPKSVYFLIEKFLQHMASK